VRKKIYNSLIYLGMGTLLALHPLTRGAAEAARLVMVEHLFDISNRFSAPSDVAVDTDGRIFVVDGVNGRIQVFADDGRHLFSFGRKGQGPGELSGALGIDIDRMGRVYIGDAGNHRIQVFSSAGDFIKAIELPSTPKHSADPVDVAVTESANRCYVSDNDNHRILTVDLATDKIIRITGENGIGEGQFRYPFQIALNRKGQLQVVDVINTRVQVIGTNGTFIRQIGDWGVETGQFFRPKAVAVDPSDRVFVSDSYMGVIQVFREGNFYAVLGDPKTRKVKRFRTPTGMCFDRRGRFYVVEMLADKVGVYRLSVVGVSE
jgi:DNA-binding beta-propeller fold protein YncE